MSTRPKLTVKQAKFVKAKAEGKTGVQAAKEVYGKKGKELDYWTANAIASENLQKPSIAQALEAEYEKQGIDMAALVKPIADGLGAEKIIMLGKGDDTTIDHVPDHSIRIAAAKLGGQWLGVGKEPVVSGGVHFHQHTEKKKADYEF